MLLFEFLGRLEILLGRRHFEGGTAALSPAISGCWLGSNAQASRDICTSFLAAFEFSAGIFLSVGLSEGRYGCFGLA